MFKKIKHFLFQKHEHEKTCGSCHLCSPLITKSLWDLVGPCQALVTKDAHFPMYGVGMPSKDDCLFLTNPWWCDAHFILMAFSPHISDNDSFLRNQYYESEVPNVSNKIASSMHYEVALDGRVSYSTIESINNPIQSWRLMGPPFTWALLYHYQVCTFNNSNCLIINIKI